VTSEAHLPATPPGSRAGRLRAFLNRLSTGAKMLIILTVALGPLGIIAVLASAQSANEGRLAREAEGRMFAQEAASALQALIVRNAVTVRATTTALSLNNAGRRACGRTLDSLIANNAVVGHVAVFENNRLECASGSGATVEATASLQPGATRISLAPHGRALRVEVAGNAPGTSGRVDIPSEALAAIVARHAPRDPYTVSMETADGVLPVVRATGIVVRDRDTVRLPIAGGQTEVVIATRVAPVRAVEVLMILLPVMMWIAAALIGWLVVDRLLVRPLTRLQRAVTAYKPGDTHLVLSDLRSPAQEIRGLGRAFAGMVTTVAGHERDLEEGLRRQTRLTREVHHRVKNNLQVVASLINLHSRGSRSAEATQAYASIQRRVDALAVVHRNHFAEMEDNRGVAVRSLVGELAANLRATAPADAALAISVAIEPLHVTQDIAIAIAFFITETVELAMSCSPRVSVAIRLVRTTDQRAALSIQSVALTWSECLHENLADRYGRVLEGLSRQLRARLERDETGGRYAVEIATLD